MNDGLEKIIRENKEAFEDDAPLGHFERFEAKLDQEFAHKQRFNKKLILRIAASLIFLLLLGNQIRMYLAPSQAPAPAPTLASVSPEYGEAEFYYTSAINQSITQWNKMVREGAISKEDQKMMKKELADFDRMHKQLQQDLEATPDDERVINAMLEYYQAKLNVIQLVVSKLEKAKQQKLTNNETEI